MTLQEAIKMLDELLDDHFDPPIDDKRQAVKLGKSALLCLRAQRHFTVPLYSALLPGETEE